MKRTSIRLTILVLSIAAAGASGFFLGRHEHGGGGAPAAAAVPGQLWTCGMHPQVVQESPGICPICHMKLTPLRRDSAEGSETPKERRVLYYWDPMLGPSSIADKPGKSAMGMDLVPVYADEKAAGPSVTIDPVIVQNMGVRTAPVVVGPLARTVRAVGYVTEAEPLQHDVNLKIGGWVERLFAHTEGMHVHAGEPLLELYSPEFLAAAEELIVARRVHERLAASVAAAPAGTAAAARDDARSTLETAREKLLLWDIAPEDVAAIEASERAPARIVLRSPATGHLMQKLVVAGSRVEAGVKAFRIVDHSLVWLDVRVFERQIPFVRVGQPVTATIDAFPGRDYDGTVIFKHPHVDDMTRTALVRVEVSNPDIALLPGMYATAFLHARLADDAILAPRSAVIHTGRREIAFVVRENGRFDPRTVETGHETDEGSVQVISGLAPGETVVTSGQFLLDVESRTREAIEKLLDSRAAAGREAAR